MLGINIWSLVGPPTENVKRRLIDRACLQRASHKITTSTSSPEDIMEKN
jgi:hypothetical protein